MAEIRGTITRKSNGTVEFMPEDAAAFGTLPEMGELITLTFDRAPRESITTAAERDAALTTRAPVPQDAATVTGPDIGATRAVAPPVDRRRR